MVRGVSRFFSLLIAGILIAYNLRRLWFSLNTLFPHKAVHYPNINTQNSSKWPDVLILVPCRDEERMIAELSKLLANLDYPSYQVVLINDGSQDSTQTQMEKCAQGKLGWHVLNLQDNVGKSGALNTALEKFAFGEIIVIYDADHRPEADTLQRIVRYFDDTLVAGVSGRTLASNPLASPSAYYSTVESYVHQMVTMRAKDRLNLAPALLGSNCAYRRTYLAACGGFRKGALLEDSDLTVTFYRAGYVIRFAEDVIAYHQVPQTVQNYLRQHMRWARGFSDVSQNHSTSMWKNKNISLPLRFELFMFTTGYLDRMALLGAGMLAVLSFLNKRLFQFPRAVLYFALVTPFLQIIALFSEQRVPRAMWLRLPWIPVFFGLDIYAALRGIADSVLRRPRIWTKTDRVEIEL